MSFTVLVTRNAEGRVRGFLASCMLEIASGVYTSPQMSAAVRDRIWDVLIKWRVGTRGDSAVMTWPDPAASGRQALRFLGEPPLELCDAGVIVLTRRDLPKREAGSLTTDEEVPF